jgi:glycosyltransferase involved in cell wall biosynthesis
MRILIISDVSGYMRGGVPTEARGLAGGLRSRGREVAFCGDIPILGDGGVGHFALSLESARHLQASVSAALVAFKPDLVHVMAMSSWRLRALGPILEGRPWVLTCHSLPPFERKISAWHANESLHYLARNLRFLPHGLAWRVLLTARRVPHVITHSQRVSDIVTRYGCPARRIRRIALGADIGTGSVREAFAAPALRAPRLVTVGGLAHTKGQHDAVRAIQALQSRVPGLSYRIIGEVRDPGYLAHLESLILRAGLSERVRIDTNLDEAAKLAALRSADLYLQPSHEEGFCLAYIEAASRVPRLVGTDSGAIRLISQGDAGMRVVPTRRPEALASAIETLLRQPLPADLMSVRAKRLQHDFSWRRYLDEHERLYEELLGVPVGSEPSTGLADVA